MGSYGHANTFSEICATIHLFIHKLLLRDITKLSKPRKRKKQEPLHVFMNSKGAAWQMWA